MFTKLEGAVTSGMIHLGDRLGLYRALADADGPLTTAELAAATGLDERWVREWAYNQAAAKLVDRRATTASGAVLADARGGRRAGVAGPRGVRHGHVPPPAADDAGARASCRRASAPGSATTTTATARRARSGSSAASSRGTGPTCCPTWCRRWTASADRLAAGARVADVGCGAGGAVLLLAGAFPASTFTGYDISQHALARADERLRRAAGSTNAAFADPRAEPLPADRSLDLVTTFDCIHDMTDPQGMMHAIRAALARRRHVAARRHQGPRHVRARTSPRTRWRR